ncbi:MAG TPA: thioredoxin-dependent thiol peroxidase [Alphaproteobacteria bacterium]|nr:thioredoxin-dependent thiol peroxidase [Alphaproteobacteria bacterium]
MSIEIGKPAPDFTLPTDGGGKIRLKDMRGKKLVLYFYPKDDTSGCTAEACGFRDRMPELTKHGIAVIGVSRDNIASHDKFKSKYGLPFALASDLEGKACEAYGTWIEKSMYGRKYMGIDRATFLIDEKGIVRAVWRKVKVPGHVEEVLKRAKG